MANSFELKAIITAVDKLSAPLKGMRREVKQFKQEFSAGLAGAAAMGAGIVTAMTGPIKHAIDFESTMADVRKVVDFDTPEQFKKMSEDVLNLSTKLPMAAEGIGQIVAAGGQAGIAKEELLSFAESAVKMGVAFDQTAEQSGQMMAEWRTAFKLTQNSVIELADKINYLSNTGPASAQKISNIVSRVGSLAETAGVSTGDLAALGATIGGIGVEAEVAGTGIQNFMLALTNASSSRAKTVLKAIGMTPKQLSKGMVKDSRATMIKVLEGLSKLPKDKQAKGLEWLFGRESIKAIAPLLTNLNLLKENFDKVADKQKYGGSMEKEYAARAATTANAIQLFKNQMYAASVSMGEIFLPTINRTIKRFMPFIEKFREWAKTHKEVIKSVARMGLYLLGTATAVGVVTRAFRIFNSVMKMSTLGKLITLMVIGGGLIVDNWDTIGPIVKSVWHDIDGVAKALGGWENILKSVAVFTAGAWLLSMSKGLGGALAMTRQLSKSLKSIANMGVITVTIAVLFDLMKRLDNLHDEAKKQNTDVGTALVNRLKDAEQSRGYTGFIPRFNEILNKVLNIDGSQNSMVPLASPKPQQFQLSVDFNNLPSGTQVKTEANQPPWFDLDVSYKGYSRFSRQ